MLNVEQDKTVAQSRVKCLHSGNMLGCKRIVYKGFYFPISLVEVIGGIW